MLIIQSTSGYYRETNTAIVKQLFKNKTRDNIMELIAGSALAVFVIAYITF